MRRPSNGHTLSGSTFENCTIDYEHGSFSDEDPGVRQAFPHGPLAITGAEGFVFTFAPIVGLVFLALIALHYAQKWGK